MYQMTAAERTAVNVALHYLVSNHQISDAHRMLFERLMVTSPQIHSDFVTHILRSSNHPSPDTVARGILNFLNKYATMTKQSGWSQKPENGGTAEVIVIKWDHRSADAAMRQNMAMMRYTVNAKPETATVRWSHEQASVKIDGVKVLSAAAAQCDGADVYKWAAAPRNVTINVFTDSSDTITEISVTYTDNYPPKQVSPFNGQFGSMPPTAPVIGTIESRPYTSPYSSPEYGGNGNYGFSPIPGYYDAWKQPMPAMRRPPRFVSPGQFMHVSLSEDEAAEAESQNKMDKDRELREAWGVLSDKSGIDPNAYRTQNSEQQKF